MIAPYDDWAPRRRVLWDDYSDDTYPPIDRTPVDTGEDCDALEMLYAAREVSR